MQLGFDMSRFEKPISKATNQRAFEIEPFVKRLNASRIASGYKPYPAALVAKHMSHIDTDDLVAFYKKLDQSNNFCALWHYYCKPKKKLLESDSNLEWHEGGLEYRD